MSVKIVIENEHVLIDPFEKLAKGLTYQQIGRFEKTFALMYADTQARVHVETGVLKASGTTRTDADESQWSGEIEYLRHPGVFELARGDRPTFNHPEGGHNFFSNLEAFDPDMEDHVEAVFRDAFDETV